MNAPTVIGLIPARSGSQRIVGKNVRRLAGHPLLAYSIASAREAGLFTRIVVSTDSPEYAAIAKHYGAEVPYLRPAQFAGATSPDIEWIRDLLERLAPHEQAYAILRPTSPFRTADMLRRAWQQFVSGPRVDSLRAVEKVRQHPGKMWLLSDDRTTMRPLMERATNGVPWHSQQYKSLPEVFVQNSSLEVIWIEAVFRTGTHAGTTFAPFLTDPGEGFSLDYEDDWLEAERKVQGGTVLLPRIEQPPF